MNKKLPLTINYAFTKYNQYVYCNDFEHAKKMLTSIEKSYDLYRLDSIPELHRKRQEAVLLMDQRLQMYMEEEFRLVEIKSYIFGGFHSRTGVAGLFVSRRIFC